MSTAKHHARSVTPRTWAIALLQSMGLPTSKSNVLVIEEWEAREGGHWLNSARYNPLNTTQPAAGTTDINSVHVKAYRSWKQGLRATRETLTNGLYDPILGALRRDDSDAAIAAIRSSPWAGSGGYHTWPTAATGRAYGHRTSPGGPFKVHPEPVTLDDIKLTSVNAGAKDGGGGSPSWVVWVIIIVAVLVILKR